MKLVMLVLLLWVIWGTGVSNSDNSLVLLIDRFGGRKVSPFNARPKRSCVEAVTLKAVKKLWWRKEKLRKEEERTVQL